MLCLLLLTCFVFPMLYSVPESTALTLSEDEQHALNIKNFRPGFCGCISSDCRATHDAVFPPLKVMPVDSVRIRAWMLERGFNLQTCCVGTACVTCMPFLATSGLLCASGSGCLTLAPSVMNPTVAAWAASLMLSWFSTAMCQPTKDGAPHEVPCAPCIWNINDGIGSGWKDSLASQIDKKFVDLVSKQWFAAARTPESSALLEKPKTMVME